MKITTALILFAAISLQYSVFCQTYSEIDYGANTQIEVQTGADVCATNILVNGTFSGGGTFCSGPLPVTISSFTSNTNNNNVMLIWRTETEKNNSGFEIERMTISPSPPEGETSAWVKTAFVPGSGTTNSPRDYSYVDKKLQTGKDKYRLKQIDYNGSFEYFELAEEVNISAPKQTHVSQNYPNPSNPKSKIDFEIHSPGKVSVKVFDMLGKEVTVLVNEYKEAGYYTTEFDGSNLASGTYFYRFESAGTVVIKKLILIK